MKNIGTEQKPYIRSENRVVHFGPPEPISATFLTSVPKLASSCTGDLFFLSNCITVPNYRPIKKEQIPSAATAVLNFISNKFVINFTSVFLPIGEANQKLGIPHVIF